ncbi:MAG: HD domain-containing protein [Spirochaetales bacterium]|nr:HD domain-containing protein [Spirochaetales bacterium]
MSDTEKYTLRQLAPLIQQGGKYRLFKPFLYNGQIFLNIEKILTESDLMRMEGKCFGPIEVVPAIEHNVNDRIRDSIAENCIKILKTSQLFHPSENSHLEFNKRKECEKIISGVIKGNAHLAQKLLEIYQFSKKLFIHSVNVSIFSFVITLGMQEKRKEHNALVLEEVFSAALLHDIGFLKLPKELTEKRRVDYSPEEVAIFKTYPVEGREIVLELSNVLRKRTIDFIYQHQERLNGSGFPQGLKGNTIDEMALVIGLADDFDLFLSKEITNSQKITASDIMSRLARSASFYGTDAVNSLYTWFRYLK